jgi:hypothetical protein
MCQSASPGAAEGSPRTPLRTLSIRVQHQGWYRRRCSGEHQTALHRQCKLWGGALKHTGSPLLERAGAFKQRVCRNAHSGPLAWSPALLRRPVVDSRRVDPRLPCVLFWRSVGHGLHRLRHLKTRWNRQPVLRESGAAVAAWVWTRMGLERGTAPTISQRKRCPRYRKMDGWGGRNGHVRSASSRIVREPC